MITKAWRALDVDGLCQGCGRIVPRSWTNCACRLWTDCAWHVDKMCRIGVDKMCLRRGQIVPPVFGDTSIWGVDKLCLFGGNLRKNRMWTNCACSRKPLLPEAFSDGYYNSNMVSVPVEYRSESARITYLPGWRAPFSNDRTVTGDSITAAAASAADRPQRIRPDLRRSGQKSPYRTCFSAGERGRYN